MRLEKQITINDDGVEYKYNLKQMSALGLHRWGERVICVLGSSGILEMDDKSLPDSLKALGNNVFQNGFGFLRNVDCDKVDVLLMELISKTCRRVVGNTDIEVNERDIETTLTDIKSLFELEKECFLINFPQFATANQSNTPISQETASGTSRRGISVQRSHH